MIIESLGIVSNFMLVLKTAAESINKSSVQSLLDKIIHTCTYFLSIFRTPNIT